MIINYEDFISILDKKIAVGDEMLDNLLKTVINNPNRYTGIFRISSAKTKLIQNITQSNEIKFGDFMEEVITLYIDKMNYTNLEKLLGENEDGDILNTDQLFTSENSIYLIEQKIRDDHDSTKKRGQFQNFIKKVDLIKSKYPNKQIIASMWFIDDGLRKNQRYYSKEMQSYPLKYADLRIYYGNEIFSKLFDRIDVWNEITSYLTKNKLERSNEVLNIPDFDISDKVLKSLNKLSLNVYRKLMSSKPEYVQLREELFPTGYNLKRMKKR